MRVAVLSLTDPWAASHGGTLRTRAIVGALAAEHDVVVIYPAADSRPPGVELPARVTAVPVVTRTLGERPWPGWLKTLKRTLLPLPTAVGGRSPALAGALEAAGDIDLLVVSVLPFAGYRSVVPGALLWVDHSDLYSDVVGREADRRTGVARLTAGLQHRACLRTEDSLAREAAITTTAGRTDAAALERRAGRNVTWLPTPVAFATVPRAQDGRRVAGFFANFHYWPNVDALQLLKEQWAPRLRDAGWDVVIAGLASDRMDAGPDVRILGPVPTPADFYRHVDLTVAPVRVGGGMKVKVLESLSHGRPVVATEFAVAGFPDDFTANVQVVDARAPDFTTLRDGPPALSPGLGAALTPYTGTAFRDTVTSLVAAHGTLAPSRQDAPR